ncbi:hypothetical protein ACFYKT_16750 [Cytobacillus sp. FJAT-53684]|uniref:Uncharacterized protein n=1 Tax=Cytobacillus mangrovibacter TaxID=3299024 RepID=A0ABW6K1D8_9BACI
MNITFTLNTGQMITAKIDGFDSAKFAKELNNPQLTFVSIGNNGFHKNSLIGWRETIDMEDYQ